MPSKQMIPGRNNEELLLSLYKPTEINATKKQLSLLLINGREMQKSPVGTPRIVIQFLRDTGTFSH